VKAPLRIEVLVLRMDISLPEPAAPPTPPTPPEPPAVWGKFPGQKRAENFPEIFGASGASGGADAYDRCRAA
jgi:hypothetical protein